jgi:streptomycin 3"-kinase
METLLDIRSGWTPAHEGESGDRVLRSADGHRFAKLATGLRTAELAGERDRLDWLSGKGIACPELLEWRENEFGALLVMSAVPGVPAVDLSGPDLFKAWPSMVDHLSVLHALPIDNLPFHKSLASMFARAADVVARGAVNPDFLPDEDQRRPAEELLARVASEMPQRLAQERADRVVCHGDPCLPNFMVDPRTLRCTGLIDLGRLGAADRYADFTLMLANAGENWTTPEEAEAAFDILFSTLRIEAPDKERLAFYLRLDPLTWG